MKYKVGDKVKIKSWSDMEQEFGLNKCGYIKCSKIFIKSMKKWCNKVVTIKEIYLNYYKIKEDDWSWSNDMIDHNATKVLSIINRLDMLKDLTNDAIFKDIINITILVLKSDNPYFTSGDVVYFNKLYYEIKRKSWRKT